MNTWEEEAGGVLGQVAEGAAAGAVCCAVSVGQVVAPMDKGEGVAGCPIMRSRSMGCHASVGAARWTLSCVPGTLRCVLRVLSCSLRMFVLLRWRARWMERAYRYEEVGRRGGKEV